MKLVLIAATLLALAFASGPAGAMSVPPMAVVQSGVTLVRDGCGPFGRRDYYGRCVGTYRPYARRCPPGLHPTPYGCRPNF